MGSKNYGGLKMETRREALKRARKLGYPESSVVTREGESFIAPLAVTSEKGKQQYAALRSQGMAKDKASAIAIAAEQTRKKKRKANR